MDCYFFECRSNDEGVCAIEDEITLERIRCCCGEYHQSCNQYSEIPFDQEKFYRKYDG